MEPLPAPDAYPGGNLREGGLGQRGRKGFNKRKRETEREREAETEREREREREKEGGIGRFKTEKQKGMPNKRERDYFHTSACRFGIKTTC